LYLSVAGACAEQKANAGGGGGGSSATGNEFIQMATSASGNYISGGAVQTLEFGFVNTLNAGTFIGLNHTVGVATGLANNLSDEIDAYSEEIESNFLTQLGHGTATSPERTTFHVPFSTAELQSNQQNTGGSSFSLLIGGFIRGWDNPSTANNSGVTSPAWTIDSAALISSSISNSCFVSLINTNDGRRTTQDNAITTNASGIYTTGSASTNLKQLILALGGGRGGFTFPAIGDTFTLRVKADGTISGAAQTQRLIDLKVTWV